jgi:hypothetical protein
MKYIVLLMALVSVAPHIFAQQTHTDTQAGGQSTKRLYIEERLKTTSGASVHCDNYGNCYGHSGSQTRNVSLETTKEFVKSCPIVTVTDNREAADYVLRINIGSSTLYKQNGDVAYVSPAKFRVTNLVKDVCNYLRNRIEN